MTTKSKSKSKSKFSKHRHAFRFKIAKPFGKGYRTVTAWAKVIPAKKDVWLELKAEHVRESIRLKGVGNIQTCSMALCASAQENSFPHTVADGYIDWYFSRAFVASKLKQGLPCECYEYAHSDDIAQLNDSKGGQLKLLAELEANGDRHVHLRPVKRADAKIRRSPPKGKNDGSRPRRKGQAARYAFVQEAELSAS